MDDPSTKQHPDNTDQPDDVAAAENTSVTSDTDPANESTEQPLNASMQDVSVLEDKEVPVLERMQRARGLIVKERDELNAIPLREYARIDQFRTVTKSTEVVLGHFQQDMNVWTEEMSKLRKELTSMNGTLERKLREESIMNWKNQIKTQSDGGKLFIVKKTKMIQ